jgi:uncharacterized damage-inducible protein DinB
MSQTLSAERADLLESLNRHRFFLLQTARDLTDAQAAERSTVSALCIGGLIKHVSATEKRWIEFAQHGPSAMPAWSDADPSAFEEHAAGFRMQPGETLAGLRADYAAVAEQTNALVASLDLDASQPLPEAPWFPPGARWTVRRVLLHIIAETAQHAGHADIIREAIDGAKTMG